MEENNKLIIEQLRTNISRYDSYFDSVNTKARFIMIFVVFIIGTIILKVEAFTKEVSPEWLLYILYVALGLIIVSSFYMLFLVVSSVVPYLKDGNAGMEENTSLVYFGDVAKSGSKKNYKDRVLAQTEDSLIDDLSRQCYVLADGLNKKFNKLRKAYYSLFVIIFSLLAITLIKVWGAV